MHWRDFQKQQRLTVLDDHFISYIDAGQGTPVLLIHGIPTWSYLWDETITALQGEHRVLAPDLLGFGFSDKRDNFDRSIAFQAVMLDRWMEKIGVASAHVIAHDIGGGVALRLATLYPQRVQSLCVMNTVCYDSWPIELMLQFGHPEIYRKAAASSSLKLLKQALKMGFATTPSEEFWDGLLAPWTTEVGKLSLIRNAAALNTNLTTEITTLLHRIRIPSLVLWGEDDKFQIMKYGARLARDIPGAQFARVPGARHFVMKDKPNEVNLSLKLFLSQIKHPEKT